MEQAQSIDPIVMDVAEDHGIKPGLLAYHVHELHGWRPTETGFAEAVEEATRCPREECALLLAELEGRVFAPVPF